MNKLKLEIDSLDVHTFAMSPAGFGGEANNLAADDSMWCTLAGACPSWFICTQDPITADC